MLQIDKGTIFAAGALVASALFFGWTISPLSAHTKIKAVRADLTKARLEVTAAKTEIRRLVKLTWSWKGAYDRDIAAEKAKAVTAINAASAGKDGQLKQAFRAGYIAGQAAGKANNGQDQNSDANDGRDRVDGVRDLRGYWQDGAFKSGDAPQ